MYLFLKCWQLEYHNVFENIFCDNTKYANIPHISDKGFNSAYKTSVMLKWKLKKKPSNSFIINKL